MVFNIKVYREKASFTQALLAQRLGVSQQVISQWETGSRRPPSDKLPLIAKTLNCTIDELFIKDTG